MRFRNEGSATLFEMDLAERRGEDGTRLINASGMAALRGSSSKKI